MDNDKLREVARAIELEPAAFRMDLWLEPDNTTLCGTVGCVAGTTVWTDEVWRDEHTIIEEGGEAWFDNMYDDEVSEYAASLLGLSHLWWREHSYPLFTSGKWWYRACKYLDLPLPDLSHLGRRVDVDGLISWVTAKHAATVLYALADGTITIEQFCDV